MYFMPFGAVKEVTGSMHLLCTDKDCILLDCGMFQGRRKESIEKNKKWSIKPELITNVVLSHGHIDHCGRIPLLTKENFHGRIITTRPTVDVCRYLLMDSAHIQESDANYLNYKTARSFLYKLENSKKNGEITHRQINSIKKQLKYESYKLNTEAINNVIEKYHLKGVEPLYTIVDAENSLNYFEGYPYQYEVTIGKSMTCTFYEAGHILGSAISLIKIFENGRTYRVMYSGDLGRFNKPIIEDPTTIFPEEDRKIDLLIMESTYGDREHDPVEGLKGKLKNAIIETEARSGSVIIPAFAFGRTQELIYFLHEIYNENQVPQLPIFIDSPLASNLTRVFGEHPEVYDEATKKTFLRMGENPFMFKGIHFVSSVQESMALINDRQPNIVIAGAGMCEAGRILHHLRYKIHNSANTILIVGYMAENTLGRRIQELGDDYENSGRQGQVPFVRFLNKDYPLAAHVKELGGFSAHGDKNEMLQFLQEAKLQIKKIALVHGEEGQIMHFRDFLHGHGYNVIVPEMEEKIDI